MQVVQTQQVALAELERARELQQQIETDPGLRGDTLLALARARWDTGDPDGARTAARDAIAAYVAADVAEPEADARRWLAEHDDPAP